jgi:hypothetical protein
MHELFRGINQSWLMDWIGRFEKTARRGYPPFTCNEERTMTAAAETAKARTVDMKLEVVVIPVSDVDRAAMSLLRHHRRSQWATKLMTQ